MKVNPILIITITIYPVSAIIMNQKLMKIPARLYEIELGPSQDMCVFVEKLLHQFVDTLKMFIHGRDFDSTGFELQSPYLTESLSVINNWVKKLGPPDNCISDMIFYAQNMFLTMEESAQILNFYNLYTTEHYLVRLIVQLNIGLFAMLDSCGVPDYTILGYNETVSRYNSKVLSWRNDYLGLEKVHFDVNIVLKNQFQKAEITLKRLIRYIPGKLV